MDALTVRETMAAICADADTRRKPNLMFVPARRELIAWTFQNAAALRADVSESVQCPASIALMVPIDVTSCQLRPARTAHRPEARIANKATMSALMVYMAMTLPVLPTGTS
jgi:hypothetical protein